MASHQEAFCEATLGETSGVARQDFLASRWRWCARLRLSVADLCATSAPRGSVRQPLPVASTRLALDGAHSNLNRHPSVVQMAIRSPSNDASAAPEKRERSPPDNAGPPGKRQRRSADADGVAAAIPSVQADSPRSISRPLWRKERERRDRHKLKLDQFVAGRLEIARKRRDNDERILDGTYNSPLEKLLAVIDTRRVESTYPIPEITLEHPAAKVIASSPRTVTLLLDLARHPFAVDALERSQALLQINNFSEEGPSLSSSSSLTSSLSPSTSSRPSALSPSPTASSPIPSLSPEVGFQMYIRSISAPSVANLKNLLIGYLRRHPADSYAIEPIIECREHQTASLSGKRVGLTYTGIAVAGTPAGRCTADKAALGGSIIVNLLRHIQRLEEERDRDVEEERGCGNLGISVRVYEFLDLRQRLPSNQSAAEETFAGLEQVGILASKPSSVNSASGGRYFHLDERALRHCFDYVAANNATWTEVGQLIPIFVPTDDDAKKVRLALSDALQFWRAHPQSCGVVMDRGTPLGSRAFDAVVQDVLSGARFVGNRGNGACVTLSKDITAAAIRGTESFGDAKLGIARGPHTRFVILRQVWGVPDDYNSLRQLGAHFDLWGFTSCQLDGNAAILFAIRMLKILRAPIITTRSGKVNKMLSTGVFYVAIKDLDDEKLNRFLSGKSRPTEDVMPGLRTPDIHAASSSSDWTSDFLLSIGNINFCQWGKDIQDCSITFAGLDEGALKYNPAVHDHFVRLTGLTLAKEALLHQSYAEALKEQIDLAIPPAAADRRAFLLDVISSTQRRAKESGLEDELQDARERLHAVFCALTSTRACAALDRKAAADPELEAERRSKAMQKAATTRRERQQGSTSGMKGETSASAALLAVREDAVTFDAKADTGRRRVGLHACLGCGVTALDLKRNFNKAEHRCPAPSFVSMPVHFTSTLALIVGISGDEGAKDLPTLLARELASKVGDASLLPTYTAASARALVPRQILQSTPYFAEEDVEILVPSNMSDDVKFSVGLDALAVATALRATDRDNNQQGDEKPAEEDASILLGAKILRCGESFPRPA